MYRINIEGAAHINEYEELVKIFLRPDDFEMTDEAGPEVTCFTEQEEKNLTKQELFRFLEKETGVHPKWGIITGIRPVKLFGMLAAEGAEKACEKFENYYLVSHERTELTRNIYEYQQELFGDGESNSAGIYIGIPFCPTRCLYCSFASNPMDEGKIEKYLEALYKEIDYCGEAMEKMDWHAESIYIGGGTPTTLRPEQLDGLLSRMEEKLISGRGNLCREITVEAGRPDTVTPEKMRVIKNHGIRRISINPQSMKQETLNAIGRDHSPQDVKAASEIARSEGIEEINADIIAGLPGEELKDFAFTLEEVIGLGADNVTVHSLAVKRSSRLKEKDPDYHYKRGRAVGEMLDHAADVLGDQGYRPYYLYRQKHMSGALENIGYCKNDAAGLYNVRIMDEHQRIIAIGAGGISKAYSPETRTLTRVPNVTNEEIYVERIDEMIERKEKDLFRRK